MVSVIALETDDQLQAPCLFLGGENFSKMKTLSGVYIVQESSPDW